jgi:hypothetical protein
MHIWSLFVYQFIDYFEDWRVAHFSDATIFAISNSFAKIQHIYMYWKWNCSKRDQYVLLLGVMFLDHDT